MEALEEVFQVYSLATRGGVLYAREGNRWHPQRGLDSCFFVKAEIAGILSAALSVPKQQPSLLLVHVLCPPPHRAGVSPSGTHQADVVVNCYCARGGFRIFLRTNTLVNFASQKFVLKESVSSRLKMCSREGRTGVQKTILLSIVRQFVLDSHHYAWLFTCTCWLIRLDLVSMRNVYSQSKKLQKWSALY